MKNSSKSQLRSTSLPLRLTPSSSQTQIEINLNKFKTLVPFYSSASIQDGLSCLIDLYLSVDELIGSSQIQQVHLQSRNRTLIEHALDVSTLLLDSYIKLVELFTIIKEHVRTLQIALRRKCVSVDSISQVHILDYVLSQKNAKKHVVDCLGSLEKMEKEIKLFLIVGEDCHLSMVIGVLREIVIATISLFRALVVSMSGKTKLHKKFSLKKFMLLGRQSCDISKEYIGDIDIIDGTLRYLQKNIRKNESKTIDKQMAIDGLQNLDFQIEGYEVGLECLFRKVIQTRVSLLNVLAN